MCVLIQPVYAQSYLVPETIERLKSPNPEVRLLAAGQLSGLRDKRAVEPLLGMLSDSDNRVRAAAVTSLGWFQDARALQPILGLLNDDDFQIRYQSIWALGMIGDVQAVEPLIKVMLESDNFGIKCQAAEALGKLHDSRAVDPLIQLLKTDAGHYAEEALVELGPVTVERFCQILVDDNNPQQWYAATMLKKIADERAIKPLISVLGIRPSALGTTAAEALSERIGAPAIDELLIALQNKSPDVRFNAVWALGGIKNERVVSPLLVVALEDPNAEVRLQAVKAVSAFEGDQVLQGLKAALNDSAVSVEAALILGEKKDLRALPNLLKILKSDNPEQAARAQRSLMAIGQPAVEDLIRVLLDRNPEYPEREIRRQHELSKQNFRLHCGNEPPPPVLDPRRLAAAALGYLGDQRAVKPLVEMLNDKSVWLQADVANALIRLGHPVNQDLKQLD